MAGLAASKANIAKDEEAYSQTAPESTLERLAIGNTSGWANVGRHAGNLVGLVSDENLKAANKLDEPLAKTGAGAVGRFVGESAATGPVGEIGAGLRGVAGIGRLAKAATLLGEGAAQGQLTSGDALGGAAIAGGLGMAGKALKPLVGGLKRSPHAETLLKAGADLTPGQLNPEGIVGRIERTAEASPLLGGMAKRARDHALRDVVPNTAADLAGMPRMPGEGLQGSAKAQQRLLKSLYGPAQNLPAPRPSSKARGSFDSVVTASLAKNVSAKDPTILKDLDGAFERLTNANTTGDIHTILSDLKRTSRKLKNANSAGARDFETARVYDDAIQWVKKYYDQALNNPALAENVRKADKIVSRVKPIEMASKAAQRGGRDTPRGTELLSAISKSTTAGEFTRGGGGHLRDIAESMAEAQQVKGGGLLERHPLLRTTLGIVTSPAALAAGSPGLRRAARGELTTQKALKVAARSPRLRRALRVLRPGLIGAVLPEETEE